MQPFSAQSLALARRLKETLPLARSRPTPSVDGPIAWFDPPSDGSATRHVSRESIFDFADAEYMEWRNVGDPRIRHETTFDGSLVDFVARASEEELAALLERVPSGLGADPHTGRSVEFSAWQRLSMVHWTSHLFDVTSTVHVDTPALQSIAQMSAGCGGRCLPIRSEASMLAGSFPDVTICDIPTACGKTSWSLAVACSKLMGSGYADLVEEFEGKYRGRILRGPATRRIPKLVLAAATPTTLDHFATTARRLVPSLRAMDASAEVVVWAGPEAARKSTRCAEQLPANTLVVWVLPMSKVVTALRQHPDVIVPFVIYDEFTVGTPRERFLTDKSIVMKQIVLQATPQALVEATRGATSWLREEFGGVLLPPSGLVREVACRRWKQASLCAAQVCQVDLMTMTPFRKYIRFDLADLVPVCLRITFVRSKRVTLAAHLAESKTEMVPLSLLDVLTSVLGNHADDASIERIRVALDGQSVTTETLTTVLGTVKAAVHTPDFLAMRLQRTVSRLATRIDEFRTECPICCRSDAPDVHIRYTASVAGVLRYAARRRQPVLQDAQSHPWHLPHSAHQCSR